MTHARERIGAYLVQDVIGRGGMGVVYRAVDQRDGTEVALKTVRAVRPGDLEGIRREIHALSLLRHPGIVRILGEGIHRGAPWYAMELCRGRSLRGVTSGVPTARVAGDDWTEASHDAPTEVVGDGDVASPPPAAAPPADVTWGLRLVRRLCSPIAYLHGEGLVHGDLKPENVIVRADGFPVIVDFGIATRVARDGSRDALDVPRELLGTACYMAPEQARAEPLDARADIYALGCILHELLTGAPPFLGSTALEIILKHRSVAPEPPSAAAPWVSPELDDLVLRMLSKDPRDRIGHAADVAERLAALGAGDDAWPGAPPARAYLYRSRTVGRDHARGLLDGRLGAAAEGRGGIVVVSGESGIGKTRLALDVAEGARGRFTVAATEASRPGGPFGCFGSLLLLAADRCRAEGPEVTRRLLGTEAPVLAAHDPSLSDVPGIGEMPPSAPLPPEAALKRLLAAVAAVLGALAAEAPLLLVLDDLGSADELSRAILELLATGRHLEGRRVLLLATLRPEDAPEDVLRLAARPGVEAVRLGRLDAEDVGRVVSDMLAVEAPHGDFVRYVAGQSEGNPFFVAEYLRAAISRGVLARDARGRFTLEPPSTGSRGYDELGLPSSLRDLIAHRLATLSPRALALAASAAVLGRDVDGELLAAVAAMEDADRLAAMTELLSRQVLEDDGARYRFVHDRIREASLASLDAAAQRACHLAAASTLAARLTDGDARAAELARHWEGAGHPAEAALSYLAAARVSCGRFALAEAQAHYERALCLEALPADAAALARLELASRVLRVRGDGGRAERELQAAVAGAAASGARELERRCLERLAHQRVLNGRNREALAAAGRAAALAVEAGDGGGKALGLHAVGAALRGMGRLRAARGALRRGLDAARAAADDGAACAILTILADLEMELGLPDDALGRLEEAITRERERGDRAGELSALATLASTRHQLGALAEAHALYAEALRLAREIGHRSIEAVVLGNLGTLLATQGQTDGAASAFLQSLAIQRALGRRRAVAVSLMNLCNLYVDLDRLAEAEAFVQESLGIHREAGDRLSEGQALLYLGGVHERRGGLAEARACYEEALDRNLETGDRRFEALSRVGLAAVLRRLGDLDLAEEHLEASRRLLEPHLDGLDLAALACQEGHLALARGGDGRGPLREAERLARALEVAPGSSLHRDLGYLERCVRFREDGGALHLGDLRDALPGRPGSDGARGDQEPSRR